jgi:hypothetical protein
MLSNILILRPRGRRRRSAAAGSLAGTAYSNPVGVIHMSIFNVVGCNL